MSGGARDRGQRPLAITGLHGADDSDDDDENSVGAQRVLARLGGGRRGAYRVEPPAWRMPSATPRDRAMPAAAVVRVGLEVAVDGASGCLVRLSCRAHTADEDRLDGLSAGAAQETSASRRRRRQQGAQWDDDSPSTEASAAAAAMVRAPAAVRQTSWASGNVWAALGSED